MVYVALGHMPIPTRLEIDPAWYDKPRITHLRDLLMGRGTRVSQGYDGDVLLLRRAAPDVRGLWEGGAVHINPITEKVSWCP